MCQRFQLPHLTFSENLHNIGCPGSSHLWRMCTIQVNRSFPTAHSDFLETTIKSSQSLLLQQAVKQPNSFFCRVSTCPGEECTGRILPMRKPRPSSTGVRPFKYKHNLQRHFVTSSRCKNHNKNLLDLS